MHFPELYALWSSGRAREVGERLFASIPSSDQPRWAGRVLAVCAPLIEPASAVDAVLALTNNPARWAEAHDAFSYVRDHVLEQDRRGASRDELRLRVLLVAEIAAKVTYNASGAPRPFDADSGSWLATNARAVVDHVGSPAFEAEVWSALVAP
jgi:hypothetical protein